MKNQNKHFTKKSLLRYLGFTLLFVTISIFSLQFLLHQFNNITFSELHIFSKNALAQMLILLFAYVVIDSFRLYFILRTLKENIVFPYVLILTFINFFICNITPFTIGGAFAMIYFLNKQGLSIGKAAAVTSLKSFLASSFNMMLIPFALYFVLTGVSGDESIKKAAIFFPIILIGYILFIVLLFKVLKHKDKINSLIYKLYKWLYNKKLISSDTFYKSYKSITKQVDSFASTFREFFGGLPRYILLSFVSTIFYYFALYAFSVIMSSDLSLDIPALEIMANQAVATFIMYFGVTPGGSGFAEGGYVYLFSKIVDSEIILAALTFYWRLFTVYITSAIGGVLFFIEVIRLHRRKRKNA